ncbi:uncharacterized protein [Amphiura filiformis]|uniref:uncharacterized protein n=1 Tax=Amphiura filiformis TaxID=82378 RepID=UPI003B224E20
MFRPVVFALLLIAVVYGHNPQNGPKNRERPAERGGFGGRKHQMRHHDSGEVIDMPDDIPVAWKLQLNNLFDRMQQDLDSGSQVDYTTWQNEAVTIIDIWITKFDEKYDFPDKYRFPIMVKQKVNEVFEGIKEDVANGETVDVQAAKEEMSRLVDRWWDRVTLVMEGDSLFSRDNMPYNMMESLTEVFNLMQNELDRGNILNVSIWHSKAHNTTSDWWNAFIKRVERRFGADHGLPRKLPQPIVDEVCSLFEHMEEEYGQGNDIILSDWQAEFETFAEKWWDISSARLQR